MLMPNYYQLAIHLLSKSSTLNINLIEHFLKLLVATLHENIFMDDGSRQGEIFQGHTLKNTVKRV